MIRQAHVKDIPQIQIVRNAVKENTLSDPGLVPDADVEDYILRRGRGWVWEEAGRIIGFSIVSVSDQNVWALFVEPGQDKKGIGRALHDEMMDWYFQQSDQPIWLSTSPGTRAEGFYRKAGWQETGLYGKGEIRFEMSRDQWQNLHPIS
ncbi:MAG: GNAT family N-acetyltransferase [Chitinophagaceae bacterium]|nr:GNAT family N-acetyltransferase [Chitinophagaceae bacterium]MBP8244220.1 GNAT family N-acetyltransferase [Chitinophagaceae bacterium]